MAQRRVFERIPHHGFTVAKAECVALSGNGSRMFIGSADGSIWFFDCRSDSPRTPSFACRAQPSVRQATREKKGAFGLRAVESWRVLLGIVDGFIKNKDLYEVTWCHNPEIRKKVSRFNLIFKLEDKDEYERRIFLAHKFRSEAELLMRYHYMIESTKIPKVRTGGGGKKTAVALPELLD